MDKTTVGLQSPWVTLRNKLDAFFREDQYVTVEQIPEDSGAEKDINIIVAGDKEKANALSVLLVDCIHMGNIIVNVVVSNDDGTPIDFMDDTDVELIKKALSGNPEFDDIKEIVDPMHMTHTYVLFRPNVIQFWNDDISDYYGNWNGLMEDIAREIFDVDGINFCTTKNNA